MAKTYLGIDNGTSGSIAIISSDGQLLNWHKTPSFPYTHYTQKGKFIGRLDRNAFREILMPYVDTPVMVVLENPFINGSRPELINVSCVASRTDEATVIVLEDLMIPFQHIAAKTWQKDMLPSNMSEGETKKASRDVAKRLFPKFEIPKGCDGDAILIAEWARRNNL